MWRRREACSGILKARPELAEVAARQHRVAPALWRHAVLQPFFSTPPQAFSKPGPNWLK